MEEKIKDYLANLLMVNWSDPNITGDTDLIKSGYLDSFGIVELITYLEAEFNIKFSDDELVDLPLSTLNQIFKSTRDKIEH